MASVNERLAVLDGWYQRKTEDALWKFRDSMSLTEHHSDYLGVRGDPDWNALKRLERKAREKGGYTEALLIACNVRPDIDFETTAFDPADFDYEFSHMKAISNATPEQVAEAVLAVLEE